MTNFSESKIGYAFDSIDSTAKYELNSIQRDQNGNEYIYLTGVASTIAGSVVTYDEAGVTTLIVANATGMVAVAQAATIASTYGWYLISGSCLVATADDVADNGNMYITATAGKVDDAIVAGDRIKGAFFRAAGTGATTVLAQFSRPLVDDIADA